MNLGKEVSRRNVLRWTRDRAIEGALSLPIAAGLSSVNMVLHPDNTGRVLKAIFEGEPINCGHGVEPSNDGQYPYDAIVVPGAGRLDTGMRTLSGRKVYIPNPVGVIRLDAAAYAYSDRLAPIIVVLDGINTRNEDGVTTRNYLQNTYKRFTGGTKTIQDAAILSDKDSVNTSTNMEELRKIMEEKHLLKVLVVTNEQHAQRTMQAGCVREIHATQKSAEDIIAEHDPERGKTLKAANQGGRADLKEKVELAESLIDPYGYLPTVYTLMNNQRRRIQVKLGIKFG